ncbi:MAG: DNA mismatch repair protein MutS [Planctomycetota bacterium]
MPGNGDTPAMRQYTRFKERYPDCLLLFRMGDFYELFREDAVSAHKTLGITLTERTGGVPMAGVPHHSVDAYIRRLIEAGFRVAVCDQIQDAREAKGVVERAVTRVLTPGTLVDDALLDESQTNHLASVYCETKTSRALVATVELSTGAFTLFDVPASSLLDELTRRSVGEVIFPDDAEDLRVMLEAFPAPATARPTWHVRHAESIEALHECFGVVTLEGFGLDDDDPVLDPAGAAVRYLRETQAMDEPTGDAPSGNGASAATAMLVRPRTLAHLSPPKRERVETSLVIDATGLRALEIERTVRGNAHEGSLVHAMTIGGCGPRTAMGRRLLRDWLCRPLAELDAIRARQRRVATLVADRRTADALLDALEGVQDVSRIAGRLGLGRATPRDLVALGRSLNTLNAIAMVLHGCPAFEETERALDDLRSTLEPVSRAILKSCVEDAPGHLREGGLIRDGVDPDLDDARTLHSESSAWLAEYQTRLAETHDLPNLKVGYNRVFRYYIELPKAQATRAPDVFTRRQTLKNAERFITPELKEFEDKVLTAGERAVSIEQRIFLDLCERASRCVRAISAFADRVAEVDVLGCFAARAHKKGWVKPELVEEPVMDLAGGRHPVLEEVLGSDFVPNACALGCADEAARLALITGPNMSGKSTYIRQVALLTLLAHAGSFVPASSARIGLCDRIFTRVGADDALHAGQSTFMVEMVETASILHHASERSLVILDEIGRGTSTLDGLALAWAIAERLCTAGARTLFATHYHELTGLAESMPERVSNRHVAVREWSNERGEREVIFLHEIRAGRASGSFGVHVARMAGLPADVVQRAGELLESLRVSHAGETERTHTPPSRRDQMSLFTEYVEHPVLTELKSFELDRMSPMDAFDALRALQRTATNPGESQ